MKEQLKILVGAVFFLMALTFISSGQEKQPGTITDYQYHSSDRNVKNGFSMSLTSEELERQTAAGLKKDLTNNELDRSTGAGIKRVTTLELELTSGRGFGSDLTLSELENMVGYGFINKLTPDEIDKISARGTLSDEQARLTIKDLAAVSAQGVRFLFDTSKFSAKEMEEIEGRGATLQDIGKYPYSIQVGVFRDKANALTMLEEVKAKGYDPYIFRTRDELGNSLFVVRLGDYETLQEAYAEVTHYTGKEHKEAFVTYINSTQSLQEDDLYDKEATASASGKKPTPPDFNKEYASDDLRALYNQIQSLQGEVDKLRTESEARRKLKMTEAEEQKEEEEILSAAGREYVLSPQGTLSFDYSFGYTHNSFDEAEWNAQRILHTADHTLTNSLAAAYALFDNLTFSFSVPFKYKYHDLGAAGSRDVNDLGDVSLSASWQPVKSEQTMPPIIVSASVSAPTGRGPYEINPEVDLSTGSGIWSVSLGFNTNKKIDPVVVFGGMAYSYQFKEDGLGYYLGSGNVLDEVEPGGGIGASLGIGYAMSYAATINASFSMSYAFGTKYHYEDGTRRKTDDDVTASLNFGTGWRFSAKRTVSFNIGIGLTNDASDFSFSFRIPFDYQL